ncbi:tonsoku-like protein isoform X1 [Megalopta genalis]|uniref:tonsoku-like protein isoform X1 n=2 Tax=Megalopta genalis TaxID=115081 RepID=UPI003FD53C45
MDIERLIKKKKRVKRDGNLQQLAVVVKELGDIYFETGKYEDALQEYTEQFEVCSIINDKLNVAVAHRMIGEIQANLGAYEEALKHQNHYLEGAKEMNSLLEEQRAYATLGRTYFCWGESLVEKSEERPEILCNARKAYMKSIRLCNELGDSNIDLKELMTMRARLLLNLGLVLEAQKEHSQAVDLMEKAAQLCKTHNLQEDFHRTQIALGGIYERKTDYESALQHFETAADVDNMLLKAEAQLFQAELLLKMEKWYGSRKILVSLYVMENLPNSIKQQVEKDLRIVATLHSTEQALSTEESTSERLKLYEILGDASVAVNCFEKAINYYREMLKCAEDIKSDRTGAAFLSLAQTLKDVGQYNEALEFAQKELQFCTDPREICRSALFLADLLIATKATDEKIQDTYNLALKNAKISNDVSLEMSVLKERLNYLIDYGSTEEVKSLQEELDALKELSAGTESESESEGNDIGANICLEDLSDVETELRAKEESKISRKRTRRKSAVVKRNEKGETQLHVACINGNIESAEKLLEAGHPTNVRDHFGWTPLHEAANHGHVEVAKLLLQHGADVNDPGSLMCQGVTPLHDAASCGNICMMKLLIDHGANLELKTNEDDTVLDCLKNWRDRVDYLSPEEQAEYDEIHKVLSAMLPTSTKKDSNRSSKSPRNSRRSINDKRDNTEKISAGEDYKRTIASLKHRSDPIGTTLTSTKRVVNPLLNSEEVLSDDWLEDDIKEGVWERKYSNDNFSTTKRKSSNGDIDHDKNSKKQKTKAQDSALSENELELTEEKSTDSCDTVVMQSLNRCKPRKKKQQLCLLSAGFTKENLSRTPSPVDLPSTNLLSNEANVLIKSIILNVSVDEKTFQTQVELSNAAQLSVDDILIDIEKMFHNDTGCKAKFHLKTMNGIAINANNVFTILNEGDIVKNFKCEIVDLETPPIVERYGTICGIYNIKVREVVSKCLKSCENTFILRLRQEDMSRQELVCILKTLVYEKNVQILDLSNGELQDIAEILNDCIFKLSGLQELYLQGCNIDSTCLSKLKKLPLQLKLLDLSYNPLGPKSHEILSKLLAPLSQLRTLNLRNCLLSSSRFLLNNSSLVNLDISWNNFAKDEPCIVLQRQLLNLNLSCTASSNGHNLAKSIVNATDFSLTNLECLELAACHLSDIDIKNILSQASNLSKFVLRGNREIGVRSLNLLLKYTPTLRHIDVSGCATIVEFPDPAGYIKSPEICLVIVSMFSNVCEHWLNLWRGKAIVKTLAHNLVIFKPTNQRLTN